MTKLRTSSRLVNISRKVHRNISSKTYEEIVFDPAFYANQKDGFAVETFPYEKDEEADHEWCYQKSNDQAKERIHSCYGKFGLRAMNEEESKQMKEFEQNKNGKQTLSISSKVTVSSQNEANHLD